MKLLRLRKTAKTAEVKARRISNYNLSPKADSDIAEIVDNTLETWGESQTYDYITELFEFLRTLADSPEIGRSAFEYAPLLKNIILRRIQYFYQPTKNGIFVVRNLG